MPELPIVERLSSVFGQYVSTFGRLRDLMVAEWPPAEHDYPPHLNQTLRFLLDVMLMRARGAYVLLLNEAYWESEIVLRSLYEAFAKCLTFATSSDVEQLLSEFWTDQRADHDRRVALQSAKAIEVFPEGDLARQIMSTLGDERLFQVEPTRNNKERRALDQKWSFAELVSALSRSGDGPTPYRNADSLLHMYGMQSVIAHVTAKFYDLLWDRDLRGDDREVLENGHLCRQMSDAVWLTAAALHSALRALGVDTKRAAEALDIAKEFSTVTQPYVDAFDASQKASYE